MFFLDCTVMPVCWRILNYTDHTPNVRPLLVFFLSVAEIQIIVQKEEGRRGYGKLLTCFRISIRLRRRRTNTRFDKAQKEKHRPIPYYKLTLLRIKQQSKSDQYGDAIHNYFKIILILQFYKYFRFQMQICNNMYRFARQGNSFIYVTLISSTLSSRSFILSLVTFQFIIFVKSFYYQFFRLIVITRSKHLVLALELYDLYPQQLDSFVLDLIVGVEGIQLGTLNNIIL